MNLPAALLSMTLMMSCNIIQHLTGDLQPKNIQSAIFEIHVSTSSDLRLDLADQSPCKSDEIV